jgi:general stress protein 26
VEIIRTTFREAGFLGAATVQISHGEGRTPFFILAVHRGPMKTEIPPTHAEALAKLRELIGDINIAMFTTVATDGTLRSRPMATLQVEANGAFWFFTADDSPKVEEIYDNRQVSLAYAAREKQSYVSVSGLARLLRDPAKTRELWTPMAKIWFPKGPDDPRLALIRVEMSAAEYWDSPSGKMVLLIGLAKLALTGHPPDKLGENVKVSSL